MQKNILSQKGMKKKYQGEKKRKKWSTSFFPVGFSTKAAAVDRSLGCIFDKSEVLYGDAMPINPDLRAVIVALKIEHTPAWGGNPWVAKPREYSGHTAIRQSIS